MLITSLVSGPALCGLFRPRVLFPPGFAQRLGADELRFVVLHELGHLRRRDLWAQVLLHVAAAVHWFNPTVWLAVRMARLDCELACDEFVLRRETAETNDGYGRALLKVLSTLRGENRLPATLGIVEGKRQLLTRISMITDYRPQTARRTLAGVVLIAAFAVAGNTKEASRKPEMSPAEIAALPRETRMQMAREKALANAAARERQFYEWTESGKIMLRGIGAPGGVPVAVFDVNGEPKVVVVNSGLIAGTVTAIDGALGRVTVSVGKKGSHEFLLTNPRPVKFPEISPQQFNFIIAPLNKRSAAADAVPNQLVLAWPAINAEGKEAILMNYLRSGWVVDIHVASDGIATTIQRLFAKQISQRNRELRTAFIESLSVEQRDRFSGAVDQAVRIDASPEATANATALAKSNQAKKDRVIEELTSEQRRLYDLWQSAQNL